MIHWLIQSIQNDSTPLQSEEHRTTYICQALKEPMGSNWKASVPGAASETQRGWWPGPWPNTRCQPGGSITSKGRSTASTWQRAEGSGSYEGGQVPGLEDHHARQQQQRLVTDRLKQQLLFCYIYSMLFPNIYYFIRFSVFYYCNPCNYYNPCFYLL